MITLQKIIRSLNDAYAPIKVYDTKMSNPEGDYFEVKILQGNSYDTHSGSRSVGALVSVIRKTNARYPADVFNNLMYELPDVIGDYTDEMTFNVVDDELHCTFKIIESVIKQPTSFVEGLHVKIGG